MFDGAIAVKSETHGFRRHQNRGLDGFIDGTENPHEDPEIRHIGTVPEGEAGAGGSYVVVQKYLHDLKKWESYNLAEQEETIYFPPIILLLYFHKDILYHHFFVFYRPQLKKLRGLLFR